MYQPYKFHGKELLEYELGDDKQHPFNPIPNGLTGELKVDPEIELNAKRFDLAISFFYSSYSDTDSEFGFARSASIKNYISSFTTTNIVSIIRGDFVESDFKFKVAADSISTYDPLPDMGIVSTLTYDNHADIFTQYMPDGMQLIFGASPASAGWVGSTPTRSRH